MKDRVQGPQLKIPEVLVNVKTIPQLNRISHNEEGIRIGAVVTLSQLETSDIINKRFGILAQAARQVATTQIRNMGTIGGNICQRSRCLYFRHPDFSCYRKGGTQCYAVTGENRFDNSITEYGVCAMTHPSDMAPALVALKTRVVIAGSSGERQLALQDFFSGANSYKETVLKSDEFVTGFHVPDQKGGTHQLFLKHRTRKSQDFALASVATVAQMAGRICQDIRIVLGAVAPFPYISTKAEETLRGKPLNERIISQASDDSLEGVHPLRMNHYKVTLTRLLIRRALTSIMRETAD
jgi:xanthine dehydrogenase YagS FAD-binding subunit